MARRADTGSRKGAEQLRPDVFVKFFLGVLVLMALAACGFVIYFWWTTTDRTVTPFGVSLCLIILIAAGFGVNRIQSHLVIEPDVLVVKDAFSTRRIERSDIGSTREVYSARRGNELRIYDKQGKRIFIPTALAQRLTESSWADGIEDVDEVAIKRVNDSFANDERLGDSEAERRWNGSNWLRRTNVLNFAAIPILILAVRLGDLPPLHWPLMIALIVMPIIAVGINVYTDGAVDLVNRGRDDGPNLQALCWSPLALFWRSLDIEGGRWGSAWAFGFCLSIVFTFWLTRLMREAGHSLGVRGPVTFLLVAMYFASTVLLLKDHRATVRHDRLYEAESSQYDPTPR